MNPLNPNGIADPTSAASQLVNGVIKEACGGNNGGDRCKGLREQLRAHEQKLTEYIANPAAVDNKVILGQGRDAQIISGRIRNLKGQIENFIKLLAACESSGGGGR